MGITRSNRLGSISILLLLFCVSSVLGNEIESCAVRLADSGGGTKDGVDQVDGTYLVTVIPIGEGGVKFAQVEAKKSIAEYFGAEIDSEEELVEWESLLVTDGKEAYRAGSDWRSRVSVLISESVKGMRFGGMLKDRAKDYVYYVISESSIATARNLEKQIQAPDTQKSGIVTVTGIGVAGRNLREPDEAKRQAVTMALTSAVEQVTGVLIVSRSVASDELSLYEYASTRTFGLIDSYEVLELIEEQESVTARIRAQVAIGRLLDDYTAISRSADMPGILVKAPNSVVLANLQDILADFGFKVVTDVSESTYLLNCETDITAIKHPVEPISGDRIQMALEFTRSNDGARLFSLTNDPRLASSFASYPEVRRNEALGKALDSMQEDLHKRINEVFAEVAQYGQDIRVYFQDYRGSHEKLLHDLVEQVRVIPGVEGLDFGIDLVLESAAIDVLYVGEIEDLAAQFRQVLESFESSGSAPILVKLDSGIIYYRFP